MMPQPAPSPTLPTPAAPAPSPPRAAKILALAASPGFLLVVLAFFLPWYSVSCGAQTLATASGWEAATTGFQTSETSPFNRDRAGGAAVASPASTREEARGAPWMLAFPLLALAGFSLALAAGLRRPPARSLCALAAFVAVLGCSLQVAHYAWLRWRLSEALAELPSRSTPLGGDAFGAGALGDQMALAMARSISLDPAGGWYLALVVGAATAAVALAAALLTRPASTARG